MTETGRRSSFYKALAGFATGFAALLLHHAWSGVCPPLFASRTLAEAWTSVSILLGIALGSLYFRSRSERLRYRPRIFVFMQVALGIASVLAMQLLLSLSGFQGIFMHGAGSSAAVTGIPGALLSFGILFVPAFLLSGLLTYGLGSWAFSIFLFLGCTLGALSQAFLIAPAGGLWVSCLAASGTMIAAGLIGLLAVSPETGPESGRVKGREPETIGSGVGGSETRGSGVGLVVTIGYGVYMLFTVLFALLSSRLIFISAGHTVQASAITAAVFFAGLALGMAVSSGPLRDRLANPAWFGLAAGLAGLYGLAISLYAPSLPLTFLNLMGDGAPTWSGLLRAYGALALMWLLFPGVVMGSVLGAARGGAGGITASGKAERRGGQGWGLTAASAGVLLALVLACLFPSRAMGLKTLHTFVPWIGIAIGLVMLALSGAPRSLRAIAGACILLAAAVLTPALPEWNRGVLTAGVYLRPARFAQTAGLRTTLSKTDVIAWEESPAALVSVERTPDAITVKNDGNFLAGTARSNLSERLSAHISILMHRRPRSLLVIGAGTGARLAAAAAHPVEEIQCVDGTHSSGRTLRPFAAHNRGVLGDKRLAIAYGDPWNYVWASDREYDLILLESPEPFTRRGAKLLTADFFKLLRSRLSPGGMVCQAISTADISPELLGMVTRTFTASFPDVSAWWTGGFEILLIGGMEPHLADPEAIRMRMALPPVAEDLSRMNISDPFGILALYVTGRKEILSLSADLPLNTVVENRLAHLWPKQTLLPRRSDALGALNRAGVNPLALVESAEDDPAAFEWARESLDSCAEARGLYLRSADQVAAGSIIRGISLLKEALDTCSLNGMLMFPLAEYYMMLSRRNAAAGRVDDAVESARRAVELDPLGPPTFYNLASIQLDSDPTTAAALLGRATELDPAYIPGYLLKAKAELSDGKPRDATETVGRVLSVEPFNPTAHHLKGLSLIQREQYHAG
jgi:spermidine synthase